MNDRMSDMDALVDVAARAIYDFNRNRHPWEASHPTIRDHLTAEARAALEAAGLPALIERVEAAEGRAAELDDELTRLGLAHIAMHELVARVEALLTEAKLPSSENDLMVYADDLRTALDASETP